MGALQKALQKGYIAALARNLRCHIPGRCNICGRRTLFLCTDRAAVRNNMYCVFCQSVSRKRHVAEVVADLLGVKFVSQIPESVRIYNADAGDAFYKVLRGRQNYTCSVFLPTAAPGAKLGEGVYCQNIERLTFDSASFDLVITEDVFEHVRDYRKGLAEVRRVLRMGGYHVFTVPCNFDRPTVVRVDTSGAEDRHLLPPEYHGDGFGGRALAYRTFGLDLLDELEAAGMKTRVCVSMPADRRYGIFDSFVFASQRGD